MMLGIETSCDETAVALVDVDGHVRVSLINSQIELHRIYGGVVPEIASRAHVQALPPLVDEAMREAGVGWKEITAIAVTRGPGLASSLLAGVAYARGLAQRLDRPLYGINHLVGHLQSIALEPSGPAVALDDPHLVLLVSGGHTCLVHRTGPETWTVLGQTIDDAAGEALDKGARLMGLGYPGGPEIQREAENGNPGAVAFPRGLAQPGAGGWRLPFTYSGVKTSLLYHLRKHPEDASPGRRADIAASYQEAVVDTLIKQLERALAQYPARMIGCGGGVARNRRLRERLAAVAEHYGLHLRLAAPAYCADNAAMIAAAAGVCYRPRCPAGSTVEVDPNLSLASPLPMA
ncbi:MAG TPA: tRNA (adenosine(37)-N6)-threonylcarbamoyltransferase complex transferase subunit TsaD [Kiritimatiellia bacterium]|nr:tRNA (adenosine(37)-N6)-threonylcarbamoyltransferase complex transferase subunit TsaD [Kiritimatiellia bacterium]HMP34909.1 tRNA (adenosine(37)-N6)-threonylcarbamoyltransferase complex transferase subunit TsaD [Kiritimatiellia bacterium]